jgi:hypothetical protein
MSSASIVLRRRDVSGQAVHVAEKFARADRIWQRLARSRHADGSDQYLLQQSS